MYNGIGGGQEGPPKNNWKLSPLIHHRLSVKNYKIHRKVELVYLHQYIFHYTSRNFHRVILVGCNSPNPSSTYIEYGNKLTLSPKSTRACPNFEFPTTMEIVGLPRSLYFGGKLFLINEVDCLVINASFLTPNFLFTIHKSFKNLAYDEICFMASNKGMFTLTYLNNS